MNRVLVDTSAYRALIRQHGSVQSALERADALAVNAVITGEIFCGFDRGGSRETNRENFERFLSARDVSVLPIDRETAERYAYLYVSLQKAGTAVAPNDLWIAATAMQYGLRLITLDRDFLRIPQILVDLHNP